MQAIGTMLPGADAPPRQPAGLPPYGRDTYAGPAATEWRRERLRALAATEPQRAAALLTQLLVASPAIDAPGRVSEDY